MCSYAPPGSSSNRRTPIEPAPTAGFTTMSPRHGGRASPTSTIRVGTIGMPFAASSSRYRLSTFHSMSGGGFHSAVTAATLAAQSRNCSRWAW